MTFNEPRSTINNQWPTANGQRSTVNGQRSDIKALNPCLNTGFKALIITFGLNFFIRFLKIECNARSEIRNKSK